MGCWVVVALFSAALFFTLGNASPTSARFEVAKGSPRTVMSNDEGSAVNFAGEGRIGVKTLSGGWSTVALSGDVVEMLDDSVDSSALSGVDPLYPNSGQEGTRTNDVDASQTRPTQSCFLPADTFDQGAEEQGLWDLVDELSSDIVQQGSAPSSSVKGQEAKSTVDEFDALLARVRSNLIAELQERPKCNVGNPSNDHAHLSVCIGETVVATLTDPMQVRAGEAKVTLGRFPSGFSALGNLEYDEVRGQLGYVAPNGDACGAKATPTLKKRDGAQDSSVAAPKQRNYKTHVYFYCQPDEKVIAEWNTHFFNHRGEDKFGLSAPNAVSTHRRKSSDPTCAMYVSLGVKSVCALDQKRSSFSNNRAKKSGDDVVPIVCH